MCNIDIMFKRLKVVKFIKYEKYKNIIYRWQHTTYSMLLDPIKMKMPYLKVRYLF